MSAWYVGLNVSRQQGTLLLAALQLYLERDGLAPDIQERGRLLIARLEESLERLALEERDLDRRTYPNKGV